MLLHVSNPQHSLIEMNLVSVWNPTWDSTFDGATFPPCSLCRFIARETISLSCVCMSECTPTNWFCPQSNRFSRTASVLCHHGTQWSRSLVINIVVIRWAAFYTCNLTCTWGMINKHNFLPLQLRGKVTGECWLNGMMFLSLSSVLFGQFYFSFLTMERTDLIFTNTNRTLETSHFNIEVQWCSWHISCLEWKQIGFIRTRHIRIYVVIEAEVRIFSTPVDWFNFLL